MTIRPIALARAPRRYLALYARSGFAEAVRARSAAPGSPVALYGPEDLLGG